MELELRVLLGIAADQMKRTSYVHPDVVGTHAWSIRGCAKLDSWHGFVSDAYLRLADDMWLTCVLCAAAVSWLSIQG